jgi:hypothetical protein
MSNETDTPRAEWRDLGLDEVIQEGDECRLSYLENDPWGVCKESLGDKPNLWLNLCFRTRRPLPEVASTNADNTSMTTITDTPQADVCPYCGAKMMIRSYVCGTNLPNSIGNCIISELCQERVVRQKAEAEAERLKGIVNAQKAELEAISCALGTNEGHSSVDHIATLKAEVERLRGIVAQLIHYPECWDTACYETMDDAIDEIPNLRDCFDCQCDQCEFNNPADK